MILIKQERKIINNLSAKSEGRRRIFSAVVVLVEVNEGHLELSDVEVELCDGQALEAALDLVLQAAVEVADVSVDLLFRTVHPCTGTTQERLCPMKIKGLNLNLR